MRSDSFWVRFSPVIYHSACFFKVSAFPARRFVRVLPICRRFSELIKFHDFFSVAAV
jgi:hypothetical protein